MNDNLVSVNHGQIVTNSRQVAVHFEKQHQHVIRDIENIVDKAEEKDASKIGRMFFETTMPDVYGRMKRVYLMNRDGFSLLVMGFTGAKALEWKLRYIEAFNTMEKALREQQAVPKITPNPHYRTRMIKTAVKDIGDTADTIAQVFHVKKGIAMTASMQMVGEAYGIDTEPLKKLVPPEANPSFLTPTKIAAELKVLTNKGNPNPQRVNSLLKEIGFQESVGGQWHATEEGKKLSEAMPYTASSGHSGYQLLWSPKVIPMLRDLLAKGGD